MARGLIFVLISLRVSSSIASNSVVLPLTDKAVQTQALCPSSFSYLNNKLEQTPCLVAAYLLGACQGGDWTVPAITPSNHYTPPDPSTQNVCSCSWSVYNLLQACAFCQGSDSSIFNWVPYISNCSLSSLSDSTFYPLNEVIPEQTAIPFWATTNPTTWPNQRFDPSVAKSIADSEDPDVTQQSRTAGETVQKRKNTGAIIGGVVGGVLVLVAIGGLTFFLRCKKKLRERHRRMTQSQGTKSFIQYARSMSDFGTHRKTPSVQSGGSVGQMPLTSAMYVQRPPLVSNFSSFQTSRSNGSMHNLNQPPAVPLLGTPPIPPQLPSHHGRSTSDSSNLIMTPSPPPHSSTPEPDHSLITPFILPPLSSQPSMTQISSSDSEYSQPTIGDKRKINPPAYTPTHSPENSLSRGLSMAVTDNSLQPQPGTAGQTSQGLSGTTILQTTGTVTRSGTLVQGLYTTQEEENAQRSPPPRSGRERKYSPDKKL